VKPYLPELLARSDARVTTNQDFTYVRQDIEQYKKTQAEGTATLNEHDAIKERERDAEKGWERQKERESRSDTGVKIYELTVENAGEPGLPAPENWLGETNNTFTLSNETSSASSQAKPSGGVKEGAKAAEEKKGPPFDPMLDETEKILEDYVSLWAKGGSLTVNP
jgi:hypothetical protein